MENTQTNDTNKLSSFAIELHKITEEARIKSDTERKRQTLKLAEDILEKIKACSVVNARAGKYELKFDSCVISSKDVNTDAVIEYLELEVGKLGFKNIIIRAKNPLNYTQGHKYIQVSCKW